jgi:4-amino-4-deoxychorismate lyase
MYNASRARAGLTSLPLPSDAHKDVLLYTAEGVVTETSIRNVAFRRGDKWITPSTQSGCLPGVVRRLMLEEGRLIEGDIRVEELRHDEMVLTMNSVEGCSLGRLAFLSHKEASSA